MQYPARCVHCIPTVECYYTQPHTVHRYTPPPYRVLKGPPLCALLHKRATHQPASRCHRTQALGHTLEHRHDHMCGTYIPSMCVIPPYNIIRGHTKLFEESCGFLLLCCMHAAQYDAHGWGWGWVGGGVLVGLWRASGDLWDECGLCNDNM